MGKQIEDDKLLRRVLDAVLKLGQRRDALLTGIPKEITFNLPEGRTPLDSLWSDLTALNEMELDDGTNPLLIWLKNAHLFAGPRVEARVLQTAIDLVERRGSAQGQSVVPFNPAQAADAGLIWAVREADAFWPRQDTRALQRILSDAYGTNLGRLMQKAQNIGLDPAVISIHQRAVVDVARDVLDEARRRGLVKALLEELRRDQGLRAWWPDLDRMLGQPAHSGSPQ